MNTETISIVKEYIDLESLKGLSKEVLLKKKNKLFDLFLFLEKPLQKITEDDLKSFVERESKGLSSHTYNWHIGFLKDFFKYLMSDAYSGESCHLFWLKVYHFDFIFIS